MRVNCKGMGEAHTSYKQNNGTADNILVKILEEIGCQAVDLNLSGSE
jgi:hypothetical protein